MKTDKLTYSFLSLREKLYRSALRFLQNDDDAKDALQDTFFKLWRNESPQSDAEARNKLFKVLRNVCIDRLRRPPNIDVKDSGVENMAIRPDFSDDTEGLEKVLTTGLTYVQKRIYISIVHDGMEYEDIASKLGMTVEAVRMNMSRARKKIRENYKKLNR